MIRNLSVLLMCAVLFGMAITTVHSHSTEYNEEDLEVYDYRYYVDPLIEKMRHEPESEPEGETHIHGWHQATHNSIGVIKKVTITDSFTDISRRDLLPIYSLHDAYLYGKPKVDVVIMIFYRGDIPQNTDRPDLTDAQAWDLAVSRIFNTPHAERDIDSPNWPSADSGWTRAVPSGEGQLYALCVEFSEDGESRSSTENPRNHLLQPLVSSYTQGLTEMSLILKVTDEELLPPAGTKWRFYRSHYHDFRPGSHAGAHGHVHGSENGMVALDRIIKSHLAEEGDDHIHQNLVLHYNLINEHHHIPHLEGKSESEQIVFQGNRNSDSSHFSSEEEEEEEEESTPAAPAGSRTKLSPVNKLTTTWAALKNK